MQRCGNGSFSLSNYGRVPFLFDVIFEIETNIIKHCPDYDGLVRQPNGKMFLSLAELRKMIGSPTSSFMSIWKFTTYPDDLILAHFQTWKLPLFQLLVQFPRPPHGTVVECLSFFHLLGDPIDTIASLMFTLQVTQNRSRRLKRNNMDRKKLEELTLLITAFEEVGDEETVVALEEE